MVASAWALWALVACIAMDALPAEASRASFFSRGSEERSSNLQAFSKWNDMLHRYEREERSGACNDSSAACERWRELKALEESLEGKPTRAKVEAINRFVNRVPYVEDRNNWGQEDYWATPREMFSGAGDCEDYAIAKYLALKETGVSESDMRLIILQDFNLGGIIHAVLEVQVDGRAVILDNQIKSVTPASRIYHYKPLYAINESNWWAYRY